MSGESRSRDIGGIYLPGQQQKVKKPFCAISEIEFFAAAETSGEPINRGFFTTKQKIEFSEVGFKASLVSRLMVALLSQIMIAVFEKLIPVFGSYEPNVVDKLYVFLLTIGLTVGYAFFIARVGKCYSKQYNITKTMINWLIGELFTGALIKMFFVFILFHFIYFVVLTPEKLYWWALYAVKTLHLSSVTVSSAYQWMLEFRGVFLTAAWFAVATTLLFILIPTVSILKTWLREKRQHRVEDL